MLSIRQISAFHTSPNTSTAKKTPRVHVIIKAYPYPLLCVSLPHGFDQYPQHGACLLHRLVVIHLSMTLFKCGNAADTCWFTFWEGLYLGKELKLAMPSTSTIWFLRKSKQSAYNSFARYAVIYGPCRLISLLIRPSLPFRIKSGHFFRMLYDRLASGRL